MSLQFTSIQWHCLSTKQWRFRSDKSDLRINHEKPNTKISLMKALIYQYDGFRGFLINSWCAFNTSSKYQVPSYYNLKKKKNPTYFCDLRLRFALLLTRIFRHLLSRTDQRRFISCVRIHKCCKFTNVLLCRSSTAAEKPSDHLQKHDATFN